MGLAVWYSPRRLGVVVVLVIMVVLVVLVIIMVIIIIMVVMVVYFRVTLFIFHMVDVTS